MNKRVYLLLLLLITLLFNLNTVKAEGPVMYIKCPNTEGKEDPYIFYKSYENENNPMWYFYNAGAHPKESQLGWCWFTSKENMNDCTKDETFGDENSNAIDKNFNQGICPATMRHNGNYWDLAGTLSNKGEVYKLEQNEYALYRIDNKEYLEYYTKDGIHKYFIDGKKTGINAIYSNLSGYSNVFLGDYYIIQSLKGDFFRIGSEEKYVSTKCYGNGKTNNADKCKQDMKDYEPILYSEDLTPLREQIDKWYKNNKAKVDAQKAEREAMESNYKDLIKTCTAFNESWGNSKPYRLSNPQTTLKELNEAYTNIEKIYSAENSLTMCTTEELVPNADAAAANCILYSSEYFGIKREMDDKQFFYIFQNEVNNILIEKKYVADNSNTIDSTNKVLEELSTCAAYLNKESDYYKLEKEETKNISEKYGSLASQHGVNVVIDCETLLGQDLIDKINSYLDIIKIAIPIILIGFGIFDFAKATFSGGEDDMKKAQQDFIKRLGIALLIFFTPVIINLVLNIANKVWGFISPDTCGLF